MNDPPAVVTPGSGNQSRERIVRLRWQWLAGAGLLLAVLATFIGQWWVRPQEPEQETDPFPLPSISESPYLNTRAEVGYVGSELCRSCHQGRHESFRHTGMGRSMATIDLAQEPPDAVFDHPPSKRRYQVRRKDGKLWHRELLLTEGSEEVVLSEFPVQYVVGSGRHSRTYLVEVDGFLVESPVTWYTSRKAWGMSPGYNTPDQPGFERATGEGCLVCHAGRSEAIGASLHRMRIIEPAIACERCHGPGELHAKRHAKQKPPGERSAQTIDYTIVNPRHLSRELAESICQQCHLRSNATIVARGRKATDFRPGLPLQDFREDYVLEVPDGSMTVVGHVEQMHLSRCYQSSKTLTCLTCHSPHNEPEPAERVAHYQAACLGCHKLEHCKVDRQTRQKESPDNNCVHCHMPTSPTEIPHLAFTHHRIGHHDSRSGARKQSPRSPQAAGVLKSFLSPSRMGEADRQRSLGLGYLEVANREPDPVRRQRYQVQALKLLSDVRAAGLRDPVLDASLARLRFDMELGDVLAYAESALVWPDLVGQDRCNALFLLADALAEQRQFPGAVAALRELTQLRRHPVDWLLLARCEDGLGDDAARIEALATAVRINPRLWKVQQHLAGHYRRQGDTRPADWHARRAVP